MNCQIVVIDFGSQVTKLIARRIRELGVYCEIIPFQNITKSFLENSLNLKGFILSGGPASVSDKKSPKIEKEILKLNIPLLGICYGAQLLCKISGGTILKSKNREFGGARLEFKKKSPLTNKINFLGKNNQVWMSHSDVITKLPVNFEIVSQTQNNVNAIFQNIKMRIFGVQFHPEVTQTIQGKKILKNFIFDVCRCKKDWNVKLLKNKIIEKIKQKVGNEKVICGLSGGVDSTVVASLINLSIGKKLFCIYINNGLMRKNETIEVSKMFKENFKINLIVKDASNLFLSRLKGIIDPEKKRKIIGKTFIEVFESEAEKIKDVKFLAQGTLYPDVIESVALVNNKQLTIKSHHNVGGLPKKMGFKLVEPLRSFFKDEVRKIGRLINVPDYFLRRHPFPGPGLGIRIIGEITKKRIRMLQEADFIFIEELKRDGLYDKIWQAFSVLLPVQTVGVMGDNRTYEQICVLRAVISTDGMTAEPFQFEHKFLVNCAKKIVNNVKGINRVSYDITSKPPATIEYE